MCTSSSVRDAPTPMATREGCRSASPRFYDRQRRHSSLGMLTPLDYESRHLITTVA